MTPRCDATLARVFWIDRRPLRQWYIWRTTLWCPHIVSTSGCASLESDSSCRKVLAGILAIHVCPFETMAQRMKGRCWNLPKAMVPRVPHDDIWTKSRGHIFLNIWKVWKVRILTLVLESNTSACLTPCSMCSWMTYQGKGSKGPLRLCLLDWRGRVFTRGRNVGAPKILSLGFRLHLGAQRSLILTSSLKTRIGMARTLHFRRQSRPTSVRFNVES